MLADMFTHIIGFIIGIGIGWCLLSWIFAKLRKHKAEKKAARLAAIASKKNTNAILAQYPTRSQRKKTKRAA